ncbi:MAG: hypothetical protein ACI9JN_002159 [Bacteroidia bacterium]|jgi:hypothetical protein
MTKNEIEWIKSCLPEKTVYPYFKDKYAWEMLRFAFPTVVDIGEVKQSKFAKFLNKPLIKEMTSTCGSGTVDFSGYDQTWMDDTSFLRLTLSQWGDIQRWKNGNYHQVSRPELNLVLQVNFDSAHDHNFYQTIGKENRYYFRNTHHPEHGSFNTLGWLRIDLDLESGEALIEEVQSDWVKEVAHYERNLKTKPKDPNCGCLACYKPGALQSYIAQFKKYKKQWDEMILSAGIWFLVNELGVKTIWYHTFETSKHYKMMPNYSLPPKSVYSKLPERFGFEKVNQTPDILKHCKALSKLYKRAKALHFYKLEF